MRAPARFRYSLPTLAAIVLAGLAMPADAQLEIFERLVMPGPVIADHADLESECESCHVRFSRNSQRTLCLDCHQEIAADLAEAAGFHGQSREVGDRECAACHTDHEGRDADIVGLVARRFDHDLTRFPLHESHTGAACDGCHGNDSSFHAAETECVACHIEDDRHLGRLGTDCAGCHRETTFADAFYDHELASGFALTGAHASLDCIGCHAGEHYEQTPTTCVGCHREDDTHAGGNGSECSGCHTTRNWNETTFDHFARTAFALSGRHSGLVCESCHVGNKLEAETPTRCVGCHLEDDAHEGINGGACENCHRETDWLDIRFEHALDAGFALNGAHASIACAGCHIDPVDVAAPATTCVGCHEADDPHARQLGADCGACHAELTWVDDVRFDHDLTTFPLLGLHREATCDDCHATHAFLDAAEQCVDCHLDDDVHEQRFASRCEQCHTPVAWRAWRFDHELETAFPLDGAHVGLDCNGCHRGAVTDTARIGLSTRCVDCHRGDDIHRGEFGNDCTQCHRTTAFTDLRELR